MSDDDRLSDCESLTAVTLTVLLVGTCVVCLKDKDFVGLLVVTFEWSFARLIAPSVVSQTINSITRSSNKIQNGDVLVPAYTGFPGKWLSSDHSFFVTMEMRDRALYFQKLNPGLSKVPGFEAV